MKMHKYVWTGQYYENGVRMLESYTELCSKCRYQKTYKGPFIYDKLPPDHDCPKCTFIQERFEF